MRLFDTHAHYDSGAFNSDRLETLAAMPEQGVELILNPGCDLESSRTAIALAEEFPFVYAAVGVHPSDCGAWEDSWLEQLRALAAHPKVRAIGEIGLDYYWKDNPPRELQQKVFARQLELAAELDLPVIVHDREAHQDCLEVVRAHPEVRGVYHCYSGSLEDAKVLVKLGWMLSFTGVITYKNARKALEVIEWLPMDRIMVETDSPYLTPEPFRGKRNDSGKVHLVAEAIARVKGMDPEEAARITLEDSWLEQLRALAAHPKVRAIGEIGLDYYWKDNPPRELQQKVFARQLELAAELDLPVIVHDREAHQDCLEVVRAHPEVRGVYHCYSGSLEDAKVLVKLGWMLSFTGVITYKNARKALEVIEWLPMDRIMVETDSPYLTPEPFRGKRNDSGKVHLVAEAIARVKGMDPEEAARITLENGTRFFRIEF